MQNQFDNLERDFAQIKLNSRSLTPKRERLGEGVFMYSVLPLLIVTGCCLVTLAVWWVFLVAFGL